MTTLRNKWVYQHSLVHCSFYFAAKVWRTKCWPRLKLLNMKKKNPWTTDVYFWNNTGKLCCYLVIYWENSDTCIFGINIEVFFLPCRRSHCVQLYIHVSLFLIREDQYQGKKTTYNHWRIALKIKTLQVHHRYFWFFPYVIQITYLINTQMEKTSFRNVVFIVWSRFGKRDRLGFNLKGVCL